MKVKKRKQGGSDTDRGTWGNRGNEKRQSNSIDYRSGNCEREVKKEGWARDIPGGPVPSLSPGEIESRDRGRIVRKQKGGVPEKLQTLGRGSGR